MSKKASYILISVVVLIVAFLVLGGGEWLWNAFLRLHGMPAGHH
jgi:hypothetical protein